MEPREWSLDLPLGVPLTPSSDAKIRIFVVSRGAACAELLAAFGRQRGVVVGDIDRGQAEQGEHAGQHEQDTGAICGCSQSRPLR